MLMIAAVQILIFGADIETILPVGTVTGMLVAIFVVFMRDSARQDARVDSAKDAQISQLTKDMDDARAGELAARAETVALRAQCAKEDREWQEKERNWNRERQELYEKLAKQHWEGL